MRFSNDHTLYCSLLLLVLVGGALTGCEGGSKNAANHQRGFRRAVVTEGGTRINLPPDNPGLRQINTIQVTKRSATIPVICPARVVASIVSGLSSNDRIVLFDSPDVTTLYSQFRQSRANTDRTSKNLGRIKEMFDNRSATAKDLNEAETEAATARATMAESEAKLRGLGYNPVELETVYPGTVWLICDVPEGQLHEVQKGEEVGIAFSSIPDRRISGRADAIGEVVDPTTRTVRVRISTPNPRGRILPGMFGRVDFGDPIDNIVLLPTSAVITVEGTDYAFVQIADTTFERRPITLANSGTTEVVVLRGISDGERVVTEGAMLLKGLSFGY